MDVILFTLGQLQREASVDKAEFAQHFPGAFLLAMGYLESKEIQAGASKLHMQRNERRDETAAISFGSRLRHDAMQQHPLAGCAFFLRAAGGKSHLLIGRGAQCDITIPDKSVSEEHCRIEVTEQGVTVNDTHSTNGTKINLQKLQPDAPAYLADEDILSLGRYSFQMFAAPTLYEELSLLATLDE